MQAAWGRQLEQLRAAAEGDRQKARLDQGRIQQQVRKSANTDARSNKRINKQTN
jgi:hypothetical protein